MSIDSSESDDSGIERVLLPVRLIVGALAVGVVMFAGVAVWLRQSGRMADVDEPSEVLPMIAVVFAGIAVAVRPLLVRVIVLALQRQGERGGLRAAPGEDPMLTIYRGATVAGAAILEGAGLLCLVVYMLSGNTTVLVAGAAQPLLIVLFHWPTLSRYRAFHERFSSGGIQGR